jgi:hypothetical protein
LPGLSWHFWFLSKRLANAQTFFIFMDGTFSVPPHPFKQLYTTRVPFKDATGTAVYAFLPNDCHDTYRELFQVVYSSGNLTSA